jgi:hypothetical protein
MPCPSCASHNQSEFPVEMVIHPTGLKNVNNPGVWLFPKFLVCLDCGFSQYRVPPSALASLGGRASKRECSNRASRHINFYRRSRAQTGC